MKANLLAIIKNSLWYGVIPKLSSIVGLFLLPILTPELSSVDFGTFGLISSITSLCCSFSSLGLYVHLTNSFYENQSYYQKIWCKIYYYIFLSSVIFSVIAFSYLFIDLYSTLKEKAFLAALLGISPIIFYSNEIISSHFFQLNNRAKEISLINLAAGLVYTIVSFILIKYFSAGFYGWLIALFFSVLIRYLLSFRILYINSIYPLFRSDYATLLKLLPVSIPLIPHTLGNIILVSSDRIIMSLLGLSIADIGIYSAGYQFADYVNFGVLAIFTATAPFIQVAIRSLDFYHLRYLYFSSFILSAFVLFNTSLFINDVFPFFMKNASLHDGARVTSLACLSFVLYVNYNLVSHFLYIKRKTNNFYMLYFIPGVFNILLNFIFIPSYGYIAAAYTTLISYWLISLIIYFVPSFNNVFVEFFGNKNLIIVQLIFCMCIGLITQLLFNFDFYIKIFVSIISFIIMCYSLIYIKRRYA